MAQIGTAQAVGARYKWVALSNTTLGVLMATINTNIVLISFFTIVTLGLAAALPISLFAGLTQAGLGANLANQIAHLPPIAALFGAFLGYNPMATLIPAAALHQMNPSKFWKKSRS
jgi:hypothetical protein